MTTKRVEAGIVGGGLSGLAAAMVLRRAGVDAQVFEASDRPGGRVRTDERGGFLLDRGFQVYLEAYPEGRRLLDLDALDLRPFETGAIVRRGGRFHRVADPLRRPDLVLETVRSGVGSPLDKLKVLALRKRAVGCTTRELWERGESTALDALRRIGFSGSIIDAFFRPWLGGIFLDRGLEVSSRAMDYVVRMMAKGGVCLPARGMESIPRQMAAEVGADAIHCGRAAERIEDGRVVFADGSAVESDLVVCAVEAPAAARLLGRPSIDGGARGVSCVYFAADESPLEEPWLVLNGEDNALVNNLVVPSDVAPDYAPSGRALVSATVLDDRGLQGAALAREVQEELEGWYGDAVLRWEYLDAYRIPHAQPDQGVGFRSRRPFARRANGKLLAMAGDHCEAASIQGALLSGRRAAEWILANKEAARAAA